MRLHRVTWCALAVVPLFATGCVLPFGPDDVRLSLARSSNVELKPVVTATTDGLTLTAIGGLLHLPVPVRHIAWLQFGLYEAKASPVAGPGNVFAGLDLPRWERIVRVRDGGEETVVLLQAGDHPHRAMLLLRQQGEEVIIAKIVGRMDRIVRDMLGGGWGASPGAMSAGGAPILSGTGAAKTTGALSAAP